LHEVISSVSEPVTERTEALLLSVNGVVDRRGVEPLTSAVQTQPRVGRQTPRSAADYASERDATSCSVNE